MGTLFRLVRHGMLLISFAGESLSRSLQVANSAKCRNRELASSSDSNIIQLPVSRDITGTVKEFLNRRTELNENASVGASDLYITFKTYCKECGIAPCSQKLFGETMTALKFERITKPPGEWQLALSRF